MTAATDETKEAFKEMIEALTKAFPGFSLSKPHQQFWLDALRKENLTVLDVTRGIDALIHNPNLAAARITLPIITEACRAVRRVRAEKEYAEQKARDRISAAQFFHGQRMPKDDYGQQCLTAIRNLYSGLWTPEKYKEWLIQKKQKGLEG